MNVNFKRGLLAAAIGAVAGVIAPILCFALVSLLSWRAYHDAGTWFQAELEWWLARGFLPVVGCVIYVGVVFWVVYTPNLRHRFAATFALLAAISVPISYALGAVVATPRRFKGEEHPALYLAELLVLGLPPLVVGAVLILLRGCKPTAAGG